MIPEHETFFEFLFTNKTIQPRTFFLAVFLLISGVCLLGSAPFCPKPYVFVIAGVLVIIPGAYFSHKAVRGYMARDRLARWKELKDVPDY